jgi:hypothetical protein
MRWVAEAATRMERKLRAIVHALVRKSLLDGHEHAEMLDGAALGIQVLADAGHETYVAIRIIGSVPRRLVATILSLVPGCELGAWMSDYAMPERAVAPEEQIWSNIMDPTAAAKFLDQEPLAKFSRMALWLVQVPSPLLGLEGALLLHVGGVPVHHRAVLPAHQADQVALGAAVGENWSFANVWRNMCGWTARGS